MRNGGYGFVSREIMRNKDLTPESKAIYAYLSSFANAKGECYPALELMQAELCMSETRLYKHLNSLIAAGILTKSHQRNGNRWGKNVYKISQSPCFEGTQNEGKDFEGTQNEGTQNEGTNNNSNNSTSYNIPSINNNRQNTRADIRPDSFAVFWNAYPRKKEKGAAQDAYMARLKDGNTPEQLLTAAKNYALECKRNHTAEQYIKHASTFLSDKLPFKDYLPVEPEDECQVADPNNPFGDEWEELKKNAEQLYGSIGWNV